MEWNFNNKTIRPGFVAGVVFLFLVIVTTVGVGYGAYYFYNEFMVAEEEVNVAASEPACNVAGVTLQGLLDTYVPPEGSEMAGDIVGSENLTFQIEQAAEDPAIKAVIVDIDSLGGSPVASAEVATALKALAKPSVAVIRGYGASGAYWVATGADIIFAHPLSDVGSIGITQSYLENTGYNTKEGYKYQDLSIGKFKNMGDPNRALTAEEKQIIMRQLEQNYNYMVEAIAVNRNMSVEEVRKLATGETWTGTEALELKLIDKLGGFPEAEAWLEQQIGTNPEICW